MGKGELSVAQLLLLFPLLRRAQAGAPPLPPPPPPTIYRMENVNVDLNIYFNIYFTTKKAPSDLREVGSQRPTIRASFILLPSLSHLFQIYIQMELSLLLSLEW